MGDFPIHKPCGGDYSSKAHIEKCMKPTIMCPVCGTYGQFHKEKTFNSFTKEHDYNLYCDKCFMACDVLDINDRLVNWSLFPDVTPEIIAKEKEVWGDDDV